MKKLRRIAFVAAGAALAAAVTVPAAGAAPGKQAAADTYSAEAESSALRLVLFGQQISIGASGADIDSPSKAHAKGQGALVVTQSFGATEATADTEGENAGSDTPTCSDLALPPAIPVPITATSACSTSQAAVTADGPSATATGSAFELSAAGTPQLAALPIGAVTGQLVGALQPILGQIPVPAAPVVDQITTLLQDALAGNGVTILRVKAGDSAATSGATDHDVTAGHQATGVTVTVLERDGLNLPPVLTIEAGETTTKVTRDRTTGAVTAEQTAVPARVTVASDIATLLQLPQNSFEVPPGQAIDLPLPPPLQSSITVSAGKTTKGDGTATAESAAVDLNLLQGLPQGGVQLALSAGSAAVAGDIPAVSPTSVAAPPPAVAPESLPRTGVEQGRLTLLALSLALAAVGIGALVVRSGRRSRLSRG
jgi:hypothetical protein